MSSGSEDTSLHVGEKIKRLREGAGLTIEQLAERAGMQPGELERIEREMISPALGVLTKICDGLGVRLGRFFDMGPRKYYALVRSSDEKVATRVASKSGADYGYEYTSLGFEKRQRVMEPFLITINPPSDASEMEKPSTHDGEEFVYVLEGELEIQLQDESFLLQPGDSIYYDASVPHRVLHRGEGPARVLAVIHLPRKT
jgi:transcriptional regulator with XRE-family HTH domain